MKTAAFLIIFILASASEAELRNKAVTPVALLHPSATPHLPLNCEFCDELKKVEMQMRTGKGTTSDFDAYQLLATSIIQKMTNAKLLLTDNQVERVVAVIDASLPHDPAKAIAENNLEVIKANRIAFNKYVSKLPKKRAEEVESAVSIALGMENPETGFEE